MRRLSDTIARLTAMRLANGKASRATTDRLDDLAEFGPNPGALRARIHIPDGLKSNAALVVVLHGCTQTAAAYDEGSGWSTLADRHGFALLYPEQQRANNPNLCFNWFNRPDITRGSGEALSIRSMIAWMVEAYDIDPERIFVTGLSAGGAMTSAMLATYPELFAGGAIIAGLAYGTAHSVQEALDRMRGHGTPDAAALAGLVRGASDHRGPWPAVSVWQGTADTTVAPGNAATILDQWRSLHGLGAEPTTRDTIDGHAHRLWRDADGRVVLEEYRIANMGHGTPLATSGPDGCGVAGPHMLESGISSTRRIAERWGLLDATVQRAAATPALKTPATLTPTVNRAERIGPIPTPSSPVPDVQKVIEDALRAAGLMR